MLNRILINRSGDCWKGLEGKFLLGCLFEFDKYNHDYPNYDYTQMVMPMRFVNRTEKLTFLNKYYNQTGFQFIPLYGRRRVGKTRLVREFIRDKRALYFLADSVTEGEQLRNLGCEVGEYIGDTILVESGFQDWQQFFLFSRSGFTDGMRTLAVQDDLLLVDGWDV